MEKTRLNMEKCSVFN